MWISRVGDRGGGRQVLVVGGHEDHVHVGDVVQLAAAALAHRHHGQPGLGGALRQLGHGDLVRGGQGRVGQRGERGHGLLQAAPAGQVGRRDPQQRQPVRPPQRRDRRCPVAGRVEAALGGRGEPVRRGRAAPASASGLATRWSPSADEAPSTAISRRRRPGSACRAASQPADAARRVRVAVLGPARRRSTARPVPAGRGGARLHHPVQLAQRQVRVGGPGQRGRAARRPARRPAPARPAATGRSPSGAEQVGGRGAAPSSAAEAVPGEPARALVGRSSRQCPSSGRLRRGLGVVQLAEGQRGEPGGERLPHLLDVGHAPRRRRRPPAPGRSPARPAAPSRWPSRRSSRRRTRCGTATPRPGRRGGTPGAGSGSRRPAGSRRRQLGDLVGVPLEHVGHQRHVPEQRVVLGGVAPADHAAGRPPARTGCARPAPACAVASSCAPRQTPGSAPGAAPPCAAAPPAPGTRARRARRPAAGTALLVAAEHHQRGVPVQVVGQRVAGVRADHPQLQARPRSATPPAGGGRRSGRSRSPARLPRRRGYRYADGTEPRHGSRSPAGRPVPTVGAAARLAA